MITKLSRNDTRFYVMIDKINELVEAHNKLAGDFYGHTHKSNTPGIQTGRQEQSFLHKQPDGVDS